MQDTTCNTGDAALILESGRFPGEGSGNSFQYSCLENTMDRGTWWGYVPWDCKVRQDLGTKPPAPTR